MATAASMQAMTYDRYGGPEVLSVDSVAKPKPANGELLIRVEAVEATKTDCEMRSLEYSTTWLRRLMPFVLGRRAPRRPTLGIYFAGVVEKVGVDVSGFAPGDAVFGSTGLRMGAYAEFVTVSGKAPIVAKPATMTFAEAAALPLGGVNGLHFVQALGVAGGDRVLVNGAGGVIGAHAVQIAADRGAVVTGVDAAHKAEFVRSMGATEFVDYQTTNITEVDARFDAIVDMVPSSPLEEMLDLVEPGGSYAHGNPPLTTMLRAPFAGRRRGKRVIVRFADETRDALRTLASMVDDQRLRPIVDQVLPIEQAAEAHRLVESEERIGAIVLAVGDLANQR